MPSYLLQAVGPDRSGIVAAVTQVLEEVGCNLGESRMTNLHDHFAIMVTLDAPTAIGRAEIAASLEGVSERFDLTVLVRELEHQPAAAGTLSSATVSIHGADRPGIVAAFTIEIARLGANIVDLATRTLAEASGVSYIMLLTVAYDPSVDLATLQSTLATTAQQLGVRCVVTQNDNDFF